MAKSPKDKDDIRDILETHYEKVNLTDEMQTSYLDYAMSVIMGRALPDVRDGLKPVHRRVLYAMSELGNTYRSPYKKSARVVGDVIGKYHPHGDAAAYETIVRMAQDFSMRYCTVDGQGNFGSVDGDSPAAQRYTEVRMTRIASDMLAGIDQETVDFVPNYDASEVEPTVLPTRVPTLLINGSAGIAVGMATNVPPHNIVEAINACLLVLDRPDCTIDEIMELLPAPDFPTGGIIYGLGGIREAYRTGRGKAIIRAKTEIEEIEGTDREAIIVKEIPYQVNKSQMLEKIAQLGSEKKIEGISFVRDESDKDGIRGVIELKRGANTEVVLNNLYKITELESSFGINLVALVDGQPKLLNIKEIIEAFINHRWEVTTRAALFQLKTARSKIYLLEGQAVALANIDEFIEVIKTSANGAEAEERLLSRSWPSALVGELISRTKLEPKYFRPEGEDLTKGLQSDGTYYLTSAQAKNILQLRLQTLTGLEHERIEKDYAELAEEIHQLVTLLNNRDLMQQKIAADLREVQESYGDARRSEIVADAKDFKTKDLIPLREMVVTMTDTGYIKSQASAEYRAQKRGGQGRKATEVKEGDIISKLFVATTHDVLLCFTDKGRMFWLNVWDLPEGSSNSKGRPIVNLLELNDEKVSVVLPISDEDFQKDLYVFMATANGTVKKTPISDFKNQRKAGIIAVNLVEGDYLIGAAITDGVHDVMLFNDEGKAVRFAEEDVRSMGRTATGVRGMRLEGDSKVIAMLVAQEDDVTVLTVTENGYGKRTPINDYTRHGRGTKGMISIQTSERNGKVVSALLVNDNDEIILLNSAGKLVRTRVNEIRVMGRNTQGVRLISMDQGVTVIGVERVTENDDGAAEDETKQLEAEAVAEEKEKQEEIQKRDDEIIAGEIIEEIDDEEKKDE
ncbi:DNA gyrase subunit A [Turicimonas muris]|uniref:DNA gyrase subunit A n=2 Tax=Turicimonas muris TaxID=1796652 RepID=A0A227KT60_9BURK|nr:DNA gyrase subunit A [Turicimonas muris]ANU67286.2 DNA gyrase subunit A [Burkholderiales bacterium YL45]OXE51037.1 DNA gyrase subunit A [Turicimonas muris]QQQ96387.1 DNA gyrase subunit A [Turicimonas muris]